MPTHHKKDEYHIYMNNNPPNLQNIQKYKKFLINECTHKSSVEDSFL